MKMNYLKKVGAVALAAVMAVTFAPVASLNVFASNSGTVNGTDIDGSATAQLDTPGTYKVTTTAEVLVTMGALSAAGTYTFDISECTGGFKLQADVDTSKAINVVIKGSKYTDTKAQKWGYGMVKSITGTSIATQDDKDKFTVSFDGDLELDGTMGGFTSDADDYDLGSNPVAKIGKRTFLGNNAITDMIPVVDADVEAQNGAVVIKELPSGKTATMVNKAGVTLKADTDEKVALTKVETVYSYTYDKDHLSNLKGSFTNDTYYAGYDTAEAAIPALSRSVTTASDISISGTVTALNTYETKITVDTKKEDVSKQDPIGAYPKDELELTSGTKYSHGMTYYTMDPTKFTNPSDGLALIDGNEYVVDGSTTGNTGELEAESREAAKTIQILRGTGASASAGNKNAYNVFSNSNGITVTGPVDESIVAVSSDYVYGKNKGTYTEYRVFGAGRYSDATEDLSVANPKKDSQLVSTGLDVAQVASGTAIDLGVIDSKVAVTKADGVGYYTVDDGTVNERNVFGATKEVTESFINEFKVKKTGIFVTGNPLNNGTIWASKEIKTTLKGIDPDVEVKGEINADHVATAADGTYTWDVNTNATGDALHVPAFRLYRKTGEHVYTISTAERDMLVAAGWVWEKGGEFKVNPVASKTGTPIYRVYNRNNGGMHFYTANAAEKDMLLQNGWTEGAVVFYGAEKATGIPVYRTYNTGSNNGEHNYTTNIAESDMNVKAGWRAEGVAFYVFK